MSRKETVKYALIKSLPIFCSYIFLGTAYGILMAEAGFPWLASVLSSIFVYTGAFQFALTALMSAGASFATIAVMAFFMGSRHSFYAISFVEDFNKMGWRKPYMMFSLTDESYAVNISLDKTGEEKRRIMFPLAVMTQSYWIMGTIIGSIAGQLIPVSMEGIDFCMTALFVIIFIDQWEKAGTHVPALAGLAVAIVCLFVFGESSFMLPALIIVSAILILYNRRQPKRKEGQGP